MNERVPRFLRWFCPPHLLEEIEGDLVQRHERDLVRHGASKARVRLCWSALGYLRPGIILRNSFTVRLFRMIMLQSYFTTATRNLLKSKVFSAINIFGLAVGLAACMLIFQFVSFEFSYDTFHEKLDRTYRVTNDRFQNGKLIQHGTIMYPTIGPTMAKDYAEVEAYTRMMPSGEANFKVSDKIFAGEQSIFADEHFFTAFSFKLISGDHLTCLKDPYSVVITEATALRYFGRSDTKYTEHLGTAIYLAGDSNPFKITGIAADTPANSHLQFSVLFSYSTAIAQDAGADNSWTWSDMRHYLVLKPGADYKALEAKFEDFSNRYFQGEKVSGSIEKFYLQPMKDAHLYSDYEYDIARTSDGRAVWAMSGIAIFILVLAWINYVNLTTSRAVVRAKEVGVRKVMGAVRSQLIGQFIVESLVVTLLALAVAVGIVAAVQGTFNQMIRSELTLASALTLLDGQAIIVLTVFFACGIILAGFYPAFVLSAYQPATVLKGKHQGSSGGRFLLKSLVVFQFVASTALIAGTLVVGKQLSFLNEADLGLNIHNTIILDPPQRTAWDSVYLDRIESFKHAVLQIEGVTKVTTSGRLPGQRLGRNFGIRPADRPSDKQYTLSVMPVDHDYIDAYGITIVAGRGFLASEATMKYEDLKTVLLNESAIRLLELGTPESAVGKVIVMGQQDKKWTVVGVVKDYHQESLHKPKEAIVFRPAYWNNSRASIKLKDNNFERVLPEIETAFNQHFPDNAFGYTILQDRYEFQYRDDRRFGQVIRIFTGLGLIISCLGLIGLSAHMAVQRTKEIGIRKVMGASLFSIVSLLTSGFMNLVIVAALVALPLAYLGVDNWLSGFAYRIELNWLMFIPPILIVVGVAAMTISAQVLKAALARPAETLKYE